MFQDKYVFAQLTAFLNRTQFNNYVRKYDGNRYVKHFTCWNQLLAMMFGQLSNRESLRDLIVALEAHRAKQYHLGLGRNTIVKATLAYANQTRDYRIFEDFAFYMMKEACKKRETNILNIPGKKYAFDSTTIPLRLTTFPWAKFRSKKRGVKAHVLFKSTKFPFSSNGFSRYSPFQLSLLPVRSRALMAGRHENAMNDFYHKYAVST